VCVAVWVATPMCHTGTAVSRSCCGRASGQSDRLADLFDKVWHVTRFGTWLQQGVLVITVLRADWRCCPCSCRGGGRVLMLACLCPLKPAAEESLNTLHFASMALRIKSIPVIMMDPQVIGPLSSHCCQQPAHNNTLCSGVSAAARQDSTGAPSCTQHGSAHVHQVAHSMVAQTTHAVCK
jgi:hypothetical protein